MPISTIIGWLKPDQNFGTFSLIRKLEQLLIKDLIYYYSRKISEKFGIPIKVLMPVPDFCSRYAL
jgi:hypothetical protein